MWKLNDKQKLEIVDLYIGGKTTSQLSKMYKVSANSIVSILKVRKVSLRGCKKYSFNENYFDIIDTEQKAYWLGFLYADGNIYKSTLSLKLAAKDKNHIEKFKKEIESTHLIEKCRNKDAYVLRISSVNLVNKVKKLGLIPNKSKIVKFPKWLNKNLTIHFIRGVFDGDGWLTSVKGREKWALGFCSGSKKFLLSIKKEIGLTGSFYKRKGGYQLLYGQKNAKICLDLFYSSSIWLDRKYNLYLDFCKFLKTKKRKSWDESKRNRDKFGKFSIKKKG